MAYTAIKAPAIQQIADREARFHLRPKDGVRQM